MEFWGVEVKVGEKVKCEPGENKLLHFSQAALGETKSKGAERVPIYVNFNNQKLVLGTLSAENCAQISYDLVFEKEFELSHGSKNASVYFTGYKTDLPEDDEFPGDSDESESEEDVPLAQNAKGPLKVNLQEEKPVKPAKAKANVDKVDSAAAKPKAKAGKLVKEEPKAGDEDEDDSDSEDADYSEESDDVDLTKAMGDGDDDEDSDEDDDEDESSEEEDEETPKKSDNDKKRPAKTTPKASATPEKKAKLTTPASVQKTGGDGKNVTPGKQSGKASANSEKPKQQTPKSGGSVSCKACVKVFHSEGALEAHTKAKHSGAK